jgi:hypothetical protein
LDDIDHLGTKFRFIEDVNQDEKLGIIQMLDFHNKKLEKSNEQVPEVRPY